MKTTLKTLSLVISALILGSLLVGCGPSGGTLKGAVENYVPADGAPSFGEILGTIYSDVKWSYGSDGEYGLAKVEAYSKRDRNIERFVFYVHKKDLTIDLIVFPNASNQSDLQLNQTVRVSRILDNMRRFQRGEWE